MTNTTQKSGRKAWMLYMDPIMIERLDKLANKKGLVRTQLLRFWIYQKLEDEENAQS